MAASANNIASTFATIPISSSSSSAPTLFNPSLLTQPNAVFPKLLSAESISTSWNPHSSLPRSHKSSFLNLYGPPGPPPPRTSLLPITCRLKPPMATGQKLPNVTLRNLDGKDRLRTITLPSLGKVRRLAIVGVSAAFSPDCTLFLRTRVEAEKSKGTDMIACIAPNDVHVMKAWGHSIDVDNKVLMLSDEGADLHTSLGIRATRFCLSCFNGVITKMEF